MGKQAEIREAWRERVVDQERSGVSIRAYCQERELCEHSFFSWRRRLRMDGPVRFALVENRREATNQNLHLRRELVKSSSSGLSRSAVDILTERHPPKIMRILFREPQQV